MDTSNNKEPLTGMANESVEIPASPAVPLDPMKKAMLLQAISQLDMLVTAFADAPNRVKVSSKEFRDALKDWADNG